MDREMIGKNKNLLINIEKTFIESQAAPTCGEILYINEEGLNTPQEGAEWVNIKVLSMFHRIHPTCTNEPNVPDLNIFQTFDQRLHRLFPLCISVLMRWVTVPNCQLPFW